MEELASAIVRNWDVALILAGGIGVLARMELTMKQLKVRVNDVEADAKQIAVVHANQERFAQDVIELKSDIKEILRELREEARRNSGRGPQH